MAGVCRKSDGAGASVGKKPVTQVARRLHPIQVIMTKGHFS
jgi:hypothetical protein